MQLTITCNLLAGWVNPPQNGLLESLTSVNKLYEHQSSNEVYHRGFDTYYPDKVTTDSAT